MKRNNILAIILLLIIFLFGLAFADSNGIWHRAEDVRPGIFGDDENDDINPYIFENEVIFNKSIVSNDVIEANVILSNSANGNVVIQLG